MAKKEIPIIVNVNRNRLTVCGGGLTDVAVCDLGSEVVADLAVVSPEKLETLVAGFVQQNNLTPGPMVIILASDVCFETEIVRGEGVEAQKEVQKFLDAVPLASFSSKVFENEKGYWVVAIGRDFYEAIRKAWEKSGFVVRMVIPGYVVGAIGVGETFDLAACQMVMKHLDTLAENGFELENKKQETFSVQRSKFFNLHKMWVIIFCVGSLIMLAVVAYIVTRRPGT